MSQQNDPIVIGLNSNISIARTSSTGWIANYVVNGAGKNVAFSDSVDLLDWLGQVLIQSDGGKRKPNAGSLEELMKQQPAATQPVAAPVPKF